MAGKKIVNCKDSLYCHPELDEGWFSGRTITALFYRPNKSGRKPWEATFRMRRRSLLSVGMMVANIFLLVAFNKVRAQEFYPVWEKGKIPGVNKIPVKDSIVAERIWQVETPGIYAFPATRAENTGTTVLICPGGGYQRASYVYNGFNFAKWFNTLGINVFVLIYRLPHQRNLTDRANAPVQDAQRAIKYIRANAGKWKVNPDKVGVMGISAGGHLVSTLSTQPDDLTRIKDILDTVKYRPDFAILLSPVVSMGQWAHKGSKANLLGADTSSVRVEKYSAEKQVSGYTPPTFIVHALNDKTVNVRNSLMYYNALVDHNINASLHVFPQGSHGIRLTENPGSTELWLPLLHSWMKEMNFLTPIPFK